MQQQNNYDHKDSTVHKVAINIINETKKEKVETVFDKMHSQFKEAAAKFTLMV